MAIIFKGASPGYSQGGVTGADNGLTLNGNTVELGGPLKRTTVIDNSAFSLQIGLSGGTNFSVRFDSNQVRLHRNGTGTGNMIQLGNSDGFMQIGNFGETASGYTGLGINLLNAISGYSINNFVRLIDFPGTEFNIPSGICIQSRQGSRYYGYGIRADQVSDAFAGIFKDASSTNTPLEIFDGNNEGFVFNLGTPGAGNTVMHFDAANNAFYVGKLSGGSYIEFRATGAEFYFNLGGGVYKNFGMPGNISEFKPKDLEPYVAGAFTDYIRFIINGAEYLIPAQLA